MTNREAVVLGQLDICEAVPETPLPKVGGVVTDRMVEDAATAYERENPKYKIELHGQALLSALEAAFRAAKEGK
jgi:hypothetical protein